MVQQSQISITADNGKAFAHHGQVAKTLDAGVFLAQPDHFWPLITGTDILTITDAEVMAVQDTLNDRPRKVLGYRTPAEALARVQGP